MRRSCAAKRASREPARDNADPRSKELENCTEHPAAIVQIGGELGVVDTPDLDEIVDADAWGRKAATDVSKSLKAAA
eukprot:g15088.t1